MKRCCKRDPVALAVTARHPADRPFGRDMDGVRINQVNPLDDIVIAGYGKSYFRVGWARYSVEFLRREQRQFNTKFAGLIRQSLIGPHDPVDLGSPSVP